MPTCTRPSLSAPFNSSAIALPLAEDTGQTNWGERPIRLLHENGLLIECRGPGFGLDSFESADRGQIGLGLLFRPPSPMALAAVMRRSRARVDTGRGSLDRTTTGADPPRPEGTPIPSSRSPTPVDSPSSEPPSNRRAGSPSTPEPRRSLAGVGSPGQLRTIAGR